MNEHEMAKMARVLREKQLGLERKSTRERVVGKVTIEDGDLIEIEKESHLDANGGIREVNTFGIRVFVCGCKANGRENFGGIDYKGNPACDKHFWRCVRCQRPLSTVTLKQIKGLCYCARCARMVRLLRLLGLKK